VLSKVAWAEVARSLRLSVRELQVVQGVFDDATEECIAARLGISPHTVHTHIRRLHQKLSVRTRTQLVVRVVASLVTEAGPLQAGRRVLHHPRKRPPAGTNPPP
jgi:DNA-binding CsgD family transcriptional regulator